jgi:hypothetical protein
MGCNTTSFVCIDDPAQKNHAIKPTLTSPGSVTGDVTSSSGAKAIIIHSTTIGGDVSQSGGGGGRSCATPKTGVFGLFHSAPYSDYEDSTIGGDLHVTGLISCWLGVARVHVTNLRLTRNTLADPDAIEVLSNQVKKDLVCRNNSPTVYDSAEAGYPGIWPRTLLRNTVGGSRVGQCVTAGPVTQGGPPVGGPF